jgi:5,10-methylenetetrahydromethanopterin reductase
VLGIGRGSLYALVRRAPPVAPLTALEEAITVIRRLTTGDTAGSAGAAFGLSRGAALCFGQPRQIPVYLGTIGPAGARLAGRIADGVRPAGQWDPAYATPVRRWAREGAERAGRDPAEVEVVPEAWACLDPDRDRARGLLAAFLPHLGPMLDFYRVPAQEVAAARAATGGDRDAPAAIGDATLDRFMAAGDAGDLRTGLERLAGAVSFSGVLGREPATALELLGAELASIRRPPTPPGDA